MKFAKRIACAVLAAALLLAGCGSDRSWAYRTAEAEPPIGAYIMTMISAVSTVEEKLTEEHAEEEGYTVPEKYSDLLKTTVDGKSFADAVAEETDKSALRYLAVEKKFAELGLELSEEQKSSASANASNYWSQNQEYYEENGVAESSLRIFLENNLKEQVLFQSLYGAEGEQEVSTDDLQAELEKNYAKADVLVMYRLQGDEEEASRKEAESLLSRVKAGEDIYELMYELDKKTAEETAEEGQEPQAVEKPEEGTRAVIFSESMRGTTYSHELVDAAMALKPGESVLVEEPFYFYILKHRDIAEDPNTLLSYYDTLLYEMKGDEFNQTLDQWVGELTVEKNEAAISRHTPSNLKMD